MVGEGGGGGERANYTHSPKCVQNSPSIASGLAVGASVIPVIIKASLFFSMDWSIGRG